MMNYKNAAELMFPNVRFHWKGDSGNPASLNNYDNIAEWDSDGLGIPKPTAQELTAFWTDWIATHPVVAREVLEAIRDAAKENVKAIPGWARWTVEEAGQWYTANVSDLLPVGNLAEANEVLANIAQAQWAIIQMLLALRNEQWPGLEAGEE